MLRQQFYTPMLQEKQLRKQFVYYTVTLGDWILEDGTWDDTGIWIDTETWNDGA